MSDAGFILGCAVIALLVVVYTEVIEPWRARRKWCEEAWRRGFEVKR